MQVARTRGALAVALCRQSVTGKPGCCYLTPGVRVRSASSIPQYIEQSSVPVREESSQHGVQRSPTEDVRTGVIRSRTTDTRTSKGFKRTRPSSPANAAGLHDDQQLVDTHSLSHTLQAHRKANKESIIIRKRLTNADHIPVERTKFRTVARHIVFERDEEQGSRMEYEGKNRELSLDWEIIGNIPRYLRLPWMKQLDHPTREYASSRLAREIQAADAFFTPTPQETLAAAQACNDLESCVLRWDRSIAKLDTIGSRANGLATPLSDLDLNLVVHNDLGTQMDTAPVELLAQLFKHLRFENDRPEQILTSYFAAQARVPIIVGVHPPTGLEYQIQSASSGYGSLEVTKCLSAEFPTIRPLFKIIKQMLKMRGLTDGARGGLTSYPLLNMIGVSLKQEPASTDAHDIATHLVNFLKFWGSIDFYTLGITHVPSRYFKKSTKALDCFADETATLDAIALVTQDPVAATPLLFPVRKKLPVIHAGKDGFMMTLHDPANPYNDLGRSAYLIKHIQATFLHVERQLKKAMSEWDRHIRAEGQSEQQPLCLLAPLIEGDYSMYNIERKRLSAWTAR